MLFSLRSDEGLTLKTSTLETLFGGQFTLSTHLIKTNSDLVPYPYISYPGINEVTREVTNHVLSERSV